MELQTVSIFKNWVELAADLPTDADRGKFYHAVCTYSLTGELPDLDGILYHYFLLIKPILDTSNRRKLAQMKGAKKRQNAQKTDLQTDLQNGLQNDLQSDSQNDLQNADKPAETDLQSDDKSAETDLQSDLLRIRVSIRDKKESKKEKVPRLFPTFVELLPDKLRTDPMIAKWREWERFRRSRKKPISEAAAVKQMAMLAELTESEAIAAIDESIKNDYQGLFPPRNKKRNNQPKDYSGV